MYIIMLGAPGTGKGTIGKSICEHYNMHHLATGDLFREEINNKTEIGIQAENYILEGKLVPDDLTLKIVLSKLDNLKDVLFDGFPRTVYQAEKLKEYLDNKNEKINAVIDLNMPDEDIILRTSSRVVCSNKKCRASYNTKFLPPKQEGVCDICGSKLIKRKDDEPEIVKKRVEVYYEETEPLINYYKKQNILKAINIDIHSTTSMEDNRNAAFKIVENSKND